MINNIARYNCKIIYKNKKMTAGNRWWGFVKEFSQCFGRQKKFN